MNYYQQGDCILKVDKLKKRGAKKIAGDLLFKGQQHHHRLRGKFEQYDVGGVRFVRATKPIELFHEEHKTIPIPAGDYRLDFVQEYDHFLEESRQVID